VNPMLALPILTASKDQDDQPHLGRRQLGIGLLTALGGGLGFAKAAQAFPNSSGGEFNAASRILARYGVGVNGGFDGTSAPGHDLLTVEVAPQPLIEYRQVVGPRNRLGEIIPCIKTSVYGDDASFTHFHLGETDPGEIDPGEIVPCVRTTLEGHTLATHELFDSDDRGDDGEIIPCIKVVSEMHEGGHLGAIEVTVFDPDENFSVVVGERTYLLIEGELREQRTEPPR
jgi:hypothetical protein